MSDGVSSSPPRARSEAWRHASWILLVVVVGYALGPARLPLVGEETCRAQHGIEMARTGDWLIATNQSVPILDRPPLQYWVLALVERCVHPLDPATVRLFMALVVLATALLVWWYARRIASPRAALIAGLAYPTMGHVLSLGRRGETDGLFTFLLAASLLVWHAGYHGGWRRSTTWILGGFLASLATLTKGMQAPIAFFGSIYVFLALRRDLRSLLRLEHLLGLLAFAVPILIWQVPFHLEAGWEGTHMTWFEPGTRRVREDFAAFVQHVVKFPFKVLGALLPWSILLLGGFDRRFWGSRRGERAPILFLGISVLSVLAPVWLSDGLPRYVMPLYPLVAVLCGVAADRVLLDETAVWLGRIWSVLLRSIAVVSAGFLALLVFATAAESSIDARWVEVLAQPWWVLAAFAVLSIVLVPFVWREAMSRDSSRVVAATVAFAILLAGAFNGPILEIMITRAEDVGPQIEQLRSRLPEDLRLVSFEPLHHKFLYYWGSDIPILPWPEAADLAPNGVEVFALNARYGETAELPFEWEPLGEFNMDPRKGDPDKSVIVARRSPTIEQPR